MTSEDVLGHAGFTADELSGGELSVRSPIDGAEIARIRETAPAEMPAVIERARQAFALWREVPAPRRGELVRLLGEELRARKETLGALVTLEAGKIVSGGAGRSAGDDRHLRLRRRPVAAALRPDHRLRAARPPHDGELASAGAVSA